VKAKEKNARPENSAQKMQLAVLGSLLAVLGVVLAVQFGGSDPSAEPVASAASASATEGQAQPAAAPAAPVADAATAPAPLLAAADNPVLSQPVQGEGLAKSPFSSFWNVARDGATASAAASEIAPPSITVNATMPSSTRALAVIDGELHFVGDLIQGWELTEIGARRVVLRSAGKTSMSFEMPLLSGARAVPGIVADG